MLALRYGGDLSAREIGELLELSEANVHQIVSRTAAAAARARRSRRLIGHRRGGRPGARCTDASQPVTRRVPSRRGGLHDGHNRPRFRGFLEVRASFPPNRGAPAVYRPSPCPACPPPLLPVKSSPLGPILAISALAALPAFALAMATIRAVGRQHGRPSKLRLPNSRRARRPPRHPPSRPRAAAGGPLRAHRTAPRCVSRSEAPQATDPSSAPGASPSDASGAAPAGPRSIRRRVRRRRIRR